MCIRDRCNVEKVGLGFWKPCGIAVNYTKYNQQMHIRRHYSFNSVRKKFVVVKREVLIP